MNLTADGLDSDSLGADDLPVAFLRPPTPAVNRDSWANDNVYKSTEREYGRASYDTPVIGAAEHHYLDHDENVHSTPSKMPSPTREKSVSSARSARHADSTSPGTYPTPTPTSSLVEEEIQNEEPLVQQQPVADEPGSEPDPTDDHEEFDSIMESEGFTMVSLDTLPSAKQYGLSSGKLSAGDPSNGRENGRIGDKLKRQLSGGISDLRSDSHSSARPSPVVLGPSSASRPSSRAHLEPQARSKYGRADDVSYPELPATSPEKTGDAPEFEQEHPIEDEEAENINPGVDGDEEDVEEIAEENWGDDDEVQVVNPSSQFRQTYSPQRSPWSSGRTQREGEWHIERQAVSRQAQDPTNIQRLITIQSDEDISQDEMVSGKDTFDTHSQSDVESAVDKEPFHEQPWEEEFVEEHRVEEVPFEQEPVDQRILEEEVIEEAPFEEEPIEEEPVEELQPKNPRDWEPEPEPIVERSHTANHEEEMEPAAYDEDDGSVDIWQQEPEYSEPAPVSQSHTTSRAAETEQETMEDDDEAFDDIWQQEALDNSYLSQHSNDRGQIPADGSSNAWRRMDGAYTDEDYLSSSPAYVTMDGDTKYLGPTHVRKLRDEDVDLSALLAQEDTPNHARYYNGTSTPRSILSRRSGPQPASINGSSKSASSHKAGQRVRLQPISQSPERESDAQVSSPAARRKLSPPGPQPDEVDDTGSVSDADQHETESIQAGSVATPEQPHQPNGDGFGSSWFQRITSLTPRWLKAPADSHDDSSSAASEDESQEDDHDDHEDMGSIVSAKEIREHLEHTPRSVRLSESPASLDETAGSPQPDPEDTVRSVEEEEEEDEEDLFIEQGALDPIVKREVPSVEEDDEDEEVDLFIEQGAPNPSAKGDAANIIVDEHHRPSGPRPLAVFGYFSDDHYKALRRVYRMAKRDPERFAYYDAPGRAQIIGDWIWTSDGRHGVPITEVQFAIIDRFVHDLSRADVHYGGSGQVEWTEADLHRRLISIIIGEQIREERKAKVWTR
jgi:hypothetical protein